MKPEIYKKEGKLILVKNRTEELFAIRNGFEYVGDIIESPFDLYDTELFKNYKPISEEEIEKELKKWRGIYNSWNETSQEEKDELRKQARELQFLFTCSYRNGTKIEHALCTPFENPVDFVSDVYDDYDMWECEIESDEVREILNLIKELYNY